MPATKDTSAELMTAYLDAELAEEDAAAFEEQLANDPDAMSEVEQLRQVMSLVSSLPEIHAPPDFYEKVSKRVRRRQLFASENVWTLVSMPFQVLSIIVILAVAALNMMAQLEQKPQKLAPEKIIGTGKPGADAPQGPAPIQP